MRIFLLVAVLLLCTPALAAAAQYTCPMHPQIVSDKPGQCPICGMDLVPIVESRLKGGSSVQISTEQVQKTGVRTEKAKRERTAVSVRATGIVKPNERGRVDLFSLTEGRVEDLKHGAIGDRVRKGDLFYTLTVSPELASRQREHLAALSGTDGNLAAATRRRLKLLGMEETALTSLEKTRQPYDRIPFYVPSDGVLTRLEIRNGHYLKPGDEIGHIQDFSTVWVEADVPEKDAAGIRHGMKAEIVFTGAAAARAATVDYIYPEMAAETRTVKIRLVVPNADGALRPGAYATVHLTGEEAERLTVPRAAVLQDVTGSHVIVALGDGKFEPRPVKTGLSGAGWTEIVSGLMEGESVVTQGRFLIDSEANLRAAFERMKEGEPPHVH